MKVHGELEVREDEDEEAANVEELELWLCDPVVCVQELISNPAFKNEIAYTPKKVYTDAQGTQRRYDEMWTGEWWWEAQVSPWLVNEAHTPKKKFQRRLPDGAIGICMGMASHHGL